MRYLKLLIATIFFFIYSCEKDNKDNIDKENSINDSILITKDYILAGDSITGSFKNISENIVFNNLGAAKPSNMESGSSSFCDYPLNIDFDSIFDIRYGAEILFKNNYAISRAFFVRNNYGYENKIEFASIQSKFINLNDTSTLLTLFNVNDTININQNWISSAESELYFISIVNLFKPYFDGFIGDNLNINTDIDDKYIGIRKKIENIYVYGWIKVSILNCQSFCLKGYSFSYKYKKKD
jgi:hypothetical protein